MRIESLESFASPDSEVRVIDKIVDAMDIESLGFKLGNNKDSGRPKFDPKDLLKLYIYGYFNGIRSSRKLAKQCVINKEVIWLIKDIKPKYRVSKRVTSSLSRTPGGFKIFQWQAYLKA